MFYKTGRIRADIAQKDYRILEQIRDFLGYGCVYKNSKWPPRWGCASANAREFLQNIYPYLRTTHKREQVRKVLANDKKYIKTKAIAKELKG